VSSRMGSPGLRLLGCMLLTAAAVVSWAPVALGDSISYDDRVGETTSRSDIKRVVVDHRHQKERLSVRARLTKVVYGVEFAVYLDTRRKNKGPEWKIWAYADSEWGILKVRGWNDQGRQGPVCGRASYTKSTDSVVARVTIPTKCLRIRSSVRVAVATIDPRNGTDWVPHRKTFLPPV
jgi:hypothetical protein